MSAYFFGSVAPADGAGLYRVEALRCGHWDYPGVEGGLAISPELLSTIERNFSLGAKGWEVPVDGPCRGGEAHSDSDAHDCGWVKRLELSPAGDSLYALLEVTNPDVRQMIDEGSLRYASSELDLAWFDPERKAELPVFTGLSLTNRPYIKRMGPLERVVNLSDIRAAMAADNDFPQSGGTTGKQEENVPEQTLADRMQGPGADAAGSAVRLSELEARLAEREAELAEARRRQRETEGRLRMTEVQSRMQALVRAGKMTLPAFQRVARLAEALLAEGRSVIQFAEKRRLGEDEATVDKVDVIEEVLDMLQELPASIATADELTLEDEEPAGEDEDERLDRMAQAALKENPKLTYREAIALSERRLRGGKR